MSIWEFVESTIFWFAVWGLALIVIDKVAEIHAKMDWNKKHNKKGEHR